MKKLSLITLALALMAIAPAALAGSAGGTLTVNATVNANCTISDATLSFGVYDPVVTNASSPLDGSTTMDVTCTKGITPNITTATAGGTITNGTDTLNYLLYSDNLRTNSFVSPGFDMPTALSKAPQTLTIYGRIPGNQDVSTGGYNGSITITVNF
jgi:spore coat protein U-like protein